MSHEVESNGALSVTHVVFDLHGGGMESLVAAMAHRFAATRVAMSVVTLSGRAGRVGAAIRDLLDQYHVVRPVPGVSMLLPMGLAQLLRRIRPDVVHLHSGSWYKGAVAARLAGVKRVVYTEHGREHHDPPLARWIDRLAARRTDVIVAVSDRLAEYLRTTVGVDPGRVLTIQNGVDTDAFTVRPPVQDLRRGLQIPEDALVVGSVGRLEPVKRYDRLIEAVAMLLRQTEGEQPVYLVLCGDGSQRSALQDYAERLGVLERMRFTGWTDRPAEFYRLLDVFALTSQSEGASVSLMEAMACGVTPVVMDVGANAEILGPDLAGQVVAPGDVSAFAATLEATLCSTKRAEMGRAARRRVVERYSLDRMIADYERLYRRLASNGTEPGGIF